MTEQEPRPCPHCDHGTDYSRAYDAVPDPKTGEPVPRGPEPCDYCQGSGYLPPEPFDGDAR